MKRIVYDIPRWSCFLHRMARGLDRADDADPVEDKIGDEIFERLYSGCPDLLNEDERTSAEAIWALKVHDQCDGLGNFCRLAAECRGDPDAAATAVEAIMGELNPRLDSGAGTSPPELRVLLRSACARASTAVEDLHEALDGLAGVGWGVSPGSNPGPGLSGSAARELARRLRSDSRLKKIALLAGRFRRIAAAKRRSKIRHGADEIADVEQGGELARLLPVELARLAHPRLRLGALRDILEQGALQYRLDGSEILGRGPLVVCLDKSGSMEGEPDLWATAAALALLDQARREKRPFAVVGFDGAVRCEHKVPVGMDLPCEALFTPCDGGTDISAVVARALDIVASHSSRLNRADIVLITDGASDTGSADALRARAAAAGVCILGVGIGVDRDVLTPWCDEAVTVRDLQTIDDGAAAVLFET